MSLLFGKEDISDSKNTEEEEKEWLEQNTYALYEEIHSGSDANPRKENVFIIGKNDSIHSKVARIILILEERKETVLLAGKSNSIGKMLSVSEIAKEKVNPNIKTILKQYNKLTKQLSLTNPNYKVKKNLEQSNKDSTNSTAENFKLIYEPKIYLLPVLYLLLVPTQQGLLHVDDWTYQAPI